MSRHALGLLLLVLVTVVWGSTFPVVKTTAKVLDPSTLIAWRFTLGLLPLLPFLLRRPKGEGSKGEAAQKPGLLWRDALVLGLWLIAGYATQTIGLQTTSANRGAFITGLSVVIVPLWLALSKGRSLPARLWGAALCAVIGIGLLSWEGGALVIGDAWVLGCALSYAGYVLALERLAGRHSALALTAAQVAVTALLAWGWALLGGHAELPPSFGWGPLLYLGLAATAATTLLQTVGQQRVSAPEAAIIYALEPVTASVFSFFLLGETVGLRGLGGGALVVIAMILSQLPERGARVQERGLTE